LASCYRTDYDNSHADIASHSLIRAYAKQLLLALVLYVLEAKVERYAEHAAQFLPDAERRDLCAGLVALRDAVAVAANPNSTAFVILIWRSIASALAILRDGFVDVDLRYQGLPAMPLETLLLDENLSTSGLPQTALALALLGRGHHAGDWTIKASVPAKLTDGVLEVTSASTTSRVFFVANGTAFARLQNEGAVADNSGDVVVVHAAHRNPQRPRSPKGAPGRTARPRPRHVVIPTIVATSATLAQLTTNFRHEAVL
jgi:hypothetical protein